MEQVIIFIIAGIAWAINAVVTKRQERAAEAEYQRRTQEAQKNPTTAKPAAPTADRRYQDIQEEIRRRIAERANSPQPGPLAPRPTAEVPPYQPSRTALPPISGRRQLQPAKPRAQPQTQPQPVATVQAPQEDKGMKAAYAISTSDADTAAASMAQYAQATRLGPDEGMKAAYALPSDDAASQAVHPLHAVLSQPLAARQAFIMREILDRPLCLRHTANGGFEDWN